MVKREVIRSAEKYEERAPAGSERALIARLVEMAQDRPIPASDAETTPLYKALVSRIRHQLWQANGNLDYMEVELAARRLAAWMEELSKEVTRRSLSNIQARKLVTSSADDQIDELISSNTDTENILVEELSKDSNLYSLPFKRTGKCVRVKCENGKSALVESFIFGGQEKTVVTKENSSGELTTWIVQSSRNAPKYKKAELEEFEKEVKKIIKMKKETMTEDEWKEFTKKQFETGSLKENLKRVKNPETLTLDQLKDILQPILQFSSTPQKETKSVNFAFNVKAEENSEQGSSLEIKPVRDVKDRKATPTFRISREPVKSVKSTRSPAKRHRDPTPSFHNRVAY